MPYTREFVKDLSKEGVTNITLVYEGSNDSGSIDDVITNIGKPLSDEVVYILKEFGHELLHRHFPGWEINEGSSGEIEITVNKEGTLSYEAQGYDGTKRGTL